VLLDPEVEAVVQLERLIVQRFAGQTVRAQQVKEYVLNETPFLDKHKRAALEAIERRGGLTAERREPGRKKRAAGTFPDHLILRFR
jgi:hypothetical protein